MPSTPLSLFCSSVLLPTLVSAYTEQIIHPVGDSAQTARGICLEPGLYLSPKFQNGVLGEEIKEEIDMSKPLTKPVMKREKPRMSTGVVQYMLPTTGTLF
jgi:hypothetical protein